MASSEVLIRSDATPLLFADSGTYAPGTNTILGSQSVQLNVASLTTGTARQSAKADLLENHAAEYDVDMTTQPADDATAGDTVDLYWARSHSATTAVGNMANVTGGDAAWTGASGVTLAESLKHMIFIGSFPLAVQNDADGVQIGTVSRFSPGAERWGILVYHWNSTVSLDGDSVECAVRFRPIIPDIQAEV